MRLLRFLFGPSLRTAIAAVAAGLAVAAGSTALLFLINALITRAEVTAESLALYAGLVVAVLASRIVAQVVTVRLSFATTRRLRVELADRVLATGLARLEALGHARLLALLTDDVAVLSAAVSGISAVSCHVLVVLGGLGYIGWLSPVALAAFVGFLVIGVLAHYAPVLKAQHLVERAYAEQTALFRHLRGLTDGAKELKLHAGRRAELAATFRDTARTHAELSGRAQIMQLHGQAWLTVMGFVAVALLLAIGPSQGLTRTELTGCSMVMVYLMAPLEMMLNVVPMVLRARVALAAVEQLGGELEEPVPAQVPARAAPDASGAPSGALARIELAGVAYAYADGDGQGFQIGPLDLALRPGEIVFVIGGNGSGKSTLAKLVTGLYEPAQGEVRLDGIPVTDATRDAYRQHFSAVFGDFHLFESLRGLGAPALDDRAQAHLARLGLAGKTAVRDGVFTTVDLSQGQRKRLALITAYLEDRPVIVFDEWAADQDPSFKRVFYRELLPELRARGKCVVAITHDDRYFDVADRIVHLADGRVDRIDEACAGPALRAAGE